MRIVTVMRSQPAWRSRAALKDQLVHPVRKAIRVPKVPLGSRVLSK
jgi:hypothetical protein